MVARSNLITLSLQDNGSDISSRKTMRRSLVSSKALKSGRRLRDADIDYKRPGTGFPITDSITGRILDIDIGRGHIFTEEDFK